MTSQYTSNLFLLYYRAIKIGSTSLHTSSQLLENLLSLLPQLAVKIPNSTFNNIQSIHIKTTTSTALPIYNISLDKRFAGPSQEEIAAREKRLKEKEEKKAEKEREREERRLERSATKDGKGRGKKQKKEKVEGEKGGKRERDEEIELDLEAPIVADGGEEKEERPMKKAKKSNSKVVEEIVAEPVKEKKEKKSKKVKA